MLHAPGTVQVRDRMACENESVEVPRNLGAISVSTPDRRILRRRGGAAWTALLDGLRKEGGCPLPYCKELEVEASTDLP